MRGLKWGLSAAMLTLLTASLGLAQFDVGRISGTVFDQSGAVVPNATVTIKNLGTGLEKKLSSDSAGTFSSPSLPPGQYAVTSTASGFGEASSGTLVLSVGATVHVDLKLPLSGSVEQVTVTGTSSTVQANTTEVGNTLNTAQIESLPLNGRDIMGYLALAPGSVTTAGMFQQSLNGQETGFTGLNTLLDGADATRIDTNATSTTFGAQASRIGRASVDSIAEFKIVNTGYSAEYGRAGGAVVNLITKSGTNEFHGALFEYFRNEKLNALNFFATNDIDPATGQEIPDTKDHPFRLNQFGGNVAGPIVKNKLFFFTNYEGVRQRITNSFLSQTLNATERAKFVLSMQPYVDVLPPLSANPVVFNSTLDWYNANLVDALREDTGSVKIDHQISDKDRWSLRYNVNDSFTNHPYNINIDQFQKVSGRSQYVRWDETHIFSPTLIMDFGFAINRQFTDGLSGEDNLPIFGNWENIGARPGPALFSELTPKTSFQFLESLTKTAGKHTLKLGSDIRRQRINNMLRTQDSLDYFSLSDLQNNAPYEVRRLGYPTLGFRSTNAGFFIQDDWKVSTRLTLNLGVRYDYNSPWNETNGRVSNFDSTTFDFTASTIDDQGTTVHVPIPPPQEGALYASDRNNFAPRIGFAYDPWGTAKTVFRGYFGISYLPMLQGAVNSLPSNNFPNQTISIFNPGYPTPGYEPSVAFPVPAVFPPGVSSNVNIFDLKARDSYYEHWAFHVEREIAPRTMLNVGYVGLHGVKLPAGAAYAGLQMNSVDVNTKLKPYPLWGDVRLLGNFLGSNYNSLQVSLRRRATKFTFDINYTWSHEIDNTVNIFGAFEDSRNINLDHGNGDIDVRHNLTADALYDLPALRNQSGVVRGIFGDWHAATILQARSGLPFTVGLQPGFFAADPQRPDYVVGQSIKPPNFSSPDSQLNPAAFTFSGAVGDRPGTVGRNTVTGPSFLQWDFSLQKRFEINERVRLEFRSDLFNILNHPNFNNPDSVLCSTYTSPGPGCAVANPGFGRSTSTLGNLVGIGTSRQVQFALKLLW